MVIERSGQPVAALIPYRDYQALLEALDELRATRRAAQAFEEWRQDPSTARAWDEVEVERNSLPETASLRETTSTHT